MKYKVNGWPHIKTLIENWRKAVKGRVLQMFGMTGNKAQKPFTKNEKLIQDIFSNKSLKDSVRVS